MKYILVALFTIIGFDLVAQRDTIYEGENCRCQEWNYNSDYEKCFMDFPSFTMFLSNDSIVPISFIGMPANSSLTLGDSILERRVIYDEKSNKAISTTWLYNNTTATVFVFYLRRKKKRA